MKENRLRLAWRGEYHSNEHQSKNDFFAGAKTKTTLEDVLDICMDVYETGTGKYEESGYYGKLRILAYWAAQLANPILFFLDDDGTRLSKSDLEDREDKYKEDLKNCGLYRRKLKEDAVKKLLDKKVRLNYILKKDLQGAFPEGEGDYVREKHIRFTQLTDGSWAFIDFVIRVRGGYVFLEVDEHQHKAPGYENRVSAPYRSGDMERMVKVMGAYWHAGNVWPVLWLRYNPDASKFVVYQSQGDTPETVPQCTDRKERERLLINHLESIDLSEEAQGGWKIEYAFYDARVVSGNTIAETTEIPTYAEAYRNLSTVPTISTIFAWDPNYAPARINDVEAPDSDTTDDDTMLPEYQVLYAEPYQQETYDSQGTDECDIMNDSPNF